MKLFTQELKEGEKVIKIIHKHWASFLIPSGKIFLAFCLPFFLAPFLFSSNIGLIIFIVLILAALVFAINIWMKWYFDLFVLTNQRIINIDQKGIFSREVSEATYINVQGANYELSGIFSMMFNYGNVKIQATGIKNLLKINSVEKPKELQELILDIKAKAEAKAEMSASELVELISRAKHLLPKQENEIDKNPETIKLENNELKDE